jgi:Tetracyclin repressor-like, C-terminal domain
LPIIVASALLRRSIADRLPCRYGIQERRRRYRRAFEDLLADGDRQGRMSVSNAKFMSFMIIEMAEGVARWFHPEGEVSINHLAYLYGGYALRIAGVYNVAQPNDR